MVSQNLHVGSWGRGRDVEGEKTTATKHTHAQAIYIKHGKMMSHVVREK